MIQQVNLFTDDFLLSAVPLIAQPDLGDGWNDLALIWQNGNHPDEALVCFQRSILCRANNAVVHNNLGNLLCRLGKMKESADSFEKAINLKADFAEAYHNLGIVWMKTSRNAGAIILFRLALACNPRFAQVHNDWGSLLLAAGQHDEAQSHFQEAVDVDPCFADAHYNLGNLFFERQRFDEALECYRNAIRLAPGFADAHNNLGNAMAALDLHHSAGTCYQAALTQSPDFPLAYGNIGLALMQCGHLAQARLAFERHLLLAPRATSAYRDLADLMRFEFGDPHLAAMEALARNMGALGLDDQIHLHFALGKALADAGDHRRSFYHFREGNSLKRWRITYHETVALEELERIAATFTAELIRKKSGHGDPSAVPVFILGMPRSGSTLVEQILASHPKIFGAGERHDLHDLAHHLPGIRPFPESVRKLSLKSLRQFGAAYIKSITKGAKCSLRVTDKMPENFKFIGLIHLALPNAKIIHTRRDPVDTCMSCFSKLFTDGQEFTFNLSELGRYFRAYEKLMDHWRNILPAGVMLDVDYEDLVADPGALSRRIIDHCGLGWDESCLAFYRTGRVIRTASAAQVRQPVYRDAVGRWKIYGDDLRPLLDALGYPSLNH